MDGHRGFLALLVAALLVGFLSVIFTLVWVLHYREGLGWDGRGPEFNWHPVLAVTGFIFIQGIGTGASWERGARGQGPREGADGSELEEREDAGSEGNEGGDGEGEWGGGAGGASPEPGRGRAGGGRPGGGTGRTGRTGGRRGVEGGTAPPGRAVADVSDRGAGDPLRRVRGDGRAPARVQTELG